MLGYGLRLERNRKRSWQAGCALAGVKISAHCFPRLHKAGSPANNAYGKYAYSRDIRYILYYPRHTNLGGYEQTWGAGIIFGRHCSSSYLAKAVFLTSQLPSQLPS